MSPNRSGIVRSIYALIDPRDTTVRYVGCAVDVENRVSQHLKDRANTPKCKWLAELRHYGLTPDVEILEVVNGFFLALLREEYWIGEMLRSGAPLTNLRNITEAEPVGRERKEVKHWKPTELWRIRVSLGLTDKDVARRAHLRDGTYYRAEGGISVKYSDAEAILQAINGFLEENGMDEVSLADLGLNLL